MHFIDPGDATVVQQADALDQRAVDGEDPLLSLRRCLREPSNLPQQRVVDLTEITVEAWEFEVEVIDQTANGRATVPHPGLHLTRLP